MRSTRFALAPFLALMAMALTAARAHAFCSEAKPLRHALDSYWTGLPEANFIGMAFSLDTDAQSGQTPIFCRFAGEETSGGTCASPAGSASDGIVYVSGDWGSSPTASGCPNPALEWGHPIVVAATSAIDEGSPSHRGVAIVVSVGYDAEANSYILDYAQPFDLSGNVQPLAAQPLPVPQVNGIRSAADGMLEVTLSWTAFATHDDCLQTARPTCTDSPGRRRQVLTGYVVYSARSSCSSPPLSGSLASGLWSPVSTTGTTGALVRVPDPGGECAWFAVGLALRGGYLPTVVSGHSRPANRSMAGTEDPEGDKPSDKKPDDAGAGDEDPGPAADNSGQGESADVPGSSPQGETGGAGAAEASAGTPAAKAAAEGKEPCVDEDNIPDDEDNCPCATNPKQEDVDFDGVGNRCDVCPVVPDASQRDGDKDGLGDPCDNCPGAANTKQDDRDADGIGEACDNCPDRANPLQEDADADGRGDACTQAIVEARRVRGPDGSRLEWRTTHEFDLVGIDLFALDAKGKERRLRDKPIPCRACKTGAPESYKVPLTAEEDKGTLVLKLVRQGGVVDERPVRVEPPAPAPASKTAPAPAAPPAGAAKPR